MEALYPSKNEIYKFLGCEQGDKIDIKRVMERVKKEKERDWAILPSLTLMIKILRK